jgi:hypothetical protein
LVFYGYFLSIYVYHMYTCSQTVILPAGARNFPGYLVGFDLLIALHPHMCEFSWIISKYDLWIVYLVY